jgi:proline dehydrogenase
LPVIFTRALETDTNVPHIFIVFDSLFFNDSETTVKEIFEEFDPNHTGNVDYITWSMMLGPKDLHKITANCREVGPLALATPTEEEIELIETMFDRGRTLASEAANVGTRLLIDAEQVRFQPAIDSLVLDLQQTFNATTVTDKPIIYNTYQCYLKDSSERLRTDVERSDRFDYHFGAKLVRGAYMESERIFAAASGLASPIHDTIEDTHESYDDSVDFLLGHSTQSNKQVELMCATHNQASIESAIEAMNKHGIDRRSSAISFAQLYGMTDHLTFNLGKHGYRAYKYVPYGEVHEVMAYLLRRARENSAIVGGAKAEICMIKNELRRRFRSPKELVSP